MILHLLERMNLDISQVLATPLAGDALASSDTICFKLLAVIFLLFKMERKVALVTMTPNLGLVHNAIRGSRAILGEQA